MMSVYPQMLVPTGNKRLDLGKGRAELLLPVEAGAFVFPRGGEPDDPFFNVAVQYHFREHVSLIASAGRSFRDGRSGTPEFSSYLGLQFTWGGHTPAAELGEHPPLRHRRKGL